MIDKDILNQVREVFSSLTGNYVLLVHAGKNDERGARMHEFADDFVSASPRLRHEDEEDGSFSFDLLKDGKPTGISFRGIPSGHEFSSLLLAILNADGKGKNLPDEMLRKRISRIKGPVSLKTYVSLTCTNCPDVVQALDVLTLLRPDFTHEMVDGAEFKDEVESLDIQGVPSVFANGELLHVGRGDFGTLLGELEDKFGSEEALDEKQTELEYDVLVIGGGPAGASASIYSARKALRTAVVAGRIGGQVNDTTGIENLISVPLTSGRDLSSALRKHMEAYKIDIFDNRVIAEISEADGRKRVRVKGGETFLAKALIIATGASWRKLGVEGESLYLGHGIHFCPHCDGPFYKGRRVAVVGGGNSGIEAAIDLAAVASHVTVVEFLDTLRADKVLLDKAESLPNVEILTSRQTMEVKGDGKSLTALALKDRTTGEIADLEVDGVFVQIGLAPNSDLVSGLLELSPRREVIVDDHCRTSVKGIYAAGDVTNVPFKQIIIAMGEGAKAALSVNEDLIRGVI